MKPMKDQQDELMNNFFNEMCEMRGDSVIFSMPDLSTRTGNIVYSSSEVANNIKEANVEKAKDRTRKKTVKFLEDSKMTSDVLEETKDSKEELKEAE